MKPPRGFPNLTAWAMHVAQINWLLAGCRLMAAANDDDDTPEAA
jgi:hypothetical protein